MPVGGGGQVGPGISGSGGGGGGGGVTSVFTRTGGVTAQTGDYTVAQVTGAAPLASPTFTGVPAGPTASGGTSTTQLATTAFVATSFAPLASPALTGTPTAPTATALTNNTQLATTAYADSATSVLSNDIPNKPQDFGTNLGWTVDPITCNASTSAGGTAGQLHLIRFRCTASGTAGNIAYTVTVSGTSLTANQCLLGIYDSGQASAGVATLLGTSSDQSTNMGTGGGYTAPLTPASAGTLVLTAGQDYFVAIMVNFSGSAPTLLAGSAANQIRQALWNNGLSGVAMRVGRGNTSSTYTTSLPSSVTTFNLTTDNSAAPHAAVVTT